MARILVVEDEADIGELYRLTLEADGHRVVGLFENPAEALTRAEELRPLDLIILDERLGAHSGTAFVPKFRAAFPGARFLLVSADPDAVKEAESRGLDEGKRKPVRLAYLAENIRGLLSS
jgi:DNA-binding response OmpR family regulator